MNHFSWLYDFFVRDNYDNHQEDEKRKDMLNLILPQVANMLVGFIKDEATDFGKEMLAKHFKQMPKEVQAALSEAQGYIGEVNIRMQRDNQKYKWYQGQQAKLKQDYDRGIQMLVAQGMPQQPKQGARE